MRGNLRARECRARDCGPAKVLVGVHLGAIDAMRTIEVQLCPSCARNCAHCCAIFFDQSTDCGAFALRSFALTLRRSIWDTMKVSNCGFRSGRCWRRRATSSRRTFSVRWQRRVQRRRGDGHDNGAQRQEDDAGADLSVCSDLAGSSPVRLELVKLYMFICLCGYVAMCFDACSCRLV